MVSSLVTRMCANGGGGVGIKQFTLTLTTIWKRIINRKEDQHQYWIAMPATTKKIAASEIENKTEDVSIMLS